MCACLHLQQLIQRDSWVEFGTWKNYQNFDCDKVCPCQRADCLRTWFEWMGNKRLVFFQHCLLSHSRPIKASWLLVMSELKPPTETNGSIGENAQINYLEASAYNQDRLHLSDRSKENVQNDYGGIIFIYLTIQSFRQHLKNQVFRVLLSLKLCK